MSRRPLAISAAPLLAALLLAAHLLADAPAADARPAADQLLRVESHVTYQVTPEQGPVRVDWDVDVFDNDPSTTLNAFGVSYFYQSVTVPVLRGATSLSATSGLGTPLSVGLDELGADSVLAATVSFDRGLFYGDTYSFSLSYELSSTRSTAVLVTPAYVFVPAVTIGDQAVVRVVTTDDPAWDVTVEPGPDCAEEADQIVCGAPDTISLAALVEVTRPDALESVDATVPLESADMALTISYFPGEDGWADRMRVIAEAALPLLEELYGAPHNAPHTLNVSERGRQDIAGYEGTFLCGATTCNIGISPVADDLTAVHELAHLWTEPYTKRWLAEGLAEFLSWRVIEDLGDLVTFVPPPQPEGLSDFALDEWGAPRYIIGADAGELAHEFTGYWEARRMFEELVDTIGLDALQRANAAAIEVGDGIDSERYFDLLDDASDANLDDLFLREVFPPSYEETLAQRRRVRPLFEQLQARSEADGLAPSVKIETLVRNWLFDRAEDEIADAEDALDAYETARDDVDASRSVWQRVGLIGADPDGQLAEAEEAYRTGYFAEAQQRAEGASRTVDGAARAGLVRIAAGGGGLILFVVLEMAVVWFVHVRPRRRAA